jgi:signal transduction histidine kinase
MRRRFRTHEHLIPLGIGMIIGAGVQLGTELLMNIDRLITGTFVYGVASLCITVAYLGLMGTLGLTLGERLPVPVAVTFTLLVALAFQPVKRRLGRLIDRLIFGQRLVGYELLARLGAMLEYAIEPADLSVRLAATVRQGLRASWARVSLFGSSGELMPLAADGISRTAATSPDLTIPIVLGDDIVGRIECGPKRRGDAYDARDRELLSTLGRQSALALQNARLTGELAERLRQLATQADELAASRTRLVEAEQAGRRRIERDIHDGVQQALVALVAKIRLARNQLGRDPEQAGITLIELQDDARQALQDLRELAQEIHPAVLGDDGLLDALDARLARLPLEVHVECDGVSRSTRFTESIEGAAYFVVSEALTNTLKHAFARHACVRLGKLDGMLRVEVTDDGCGFDPQRVERRGLSGLADRIRSTRRHHARCEPAPRRYQYRGQPARRGTHG